MNADPTSTRDWIKYEAACQAAWAWARLEIQAGAIPLTAIRKAIEAAWPELDGQVVTNILENALLDSPPAGTA